MNEEKGCLILKSSGRPWDEHLYPTKEAAEETANNCKVDGFSIVPGKRVSSWVGASGTTIKLETRLIFEDPRQAEKAAKP